MEFKFYRYIEDDKIIEARPFILGEDLSEIHVSDGDNPMFNDNGMIARDPKNPDHRWWYIPGTYFKNNFKEDNLKQNTKSLGNTDANGAIKNVKDIVFWGDGDTFKLISKASSVTEGWMKSTKAMQAGKSVVVQVTTQQRNPDGSYSIAEALATVTNAIILENRDLSGTVISRYIDYLD